MRNKIALATVVVSSLLAAGCTTGERAVGGAAVGGIGGAAVGNSVAGTGGAVVGGVGGAVVGSAVGQSL